ncbi:MAG: NTP/NDP exchange transporter [Gammaproteobacteria bacterium]
MSEPMENATPRSWFAGVMDARLSGDVQKILLLFLFFFFVIAAFWTLKPLRTSSVVKAFGVDYYPLIKQGVVLFIPFVVMFYSMMTSMLSRRHLVQFFTAIFIVFNVVFWCLFQWTPAGWVKVAFFFYVDTYITVMVALFWTYLNDVYKPDEAKRVYGVIGAGGLTGGIVGASISGWASELLGNNIVLVATVLLVPIAVIIRLLEESAGKDAQPVIAASGKGDRSPGKVFFEGATTVLKSRYLLSVVAIVGLYEIISTIIDYQFNASASAAYETRDALAGFQGKVFFIAQIFALGIQLFITSWVHRKFGVLTGLLFLPLALMTGSVMFLIAPLLSVITLVIASEAALAYSINQASKEILYVPLDAVSKYKGKAFIDMFGLRAAKTVGAIILLVYILVLRDYGFGVGFLVGVCIVALVGWLGAVWYVGNAFVERASAPTPLSGVAENS